MFFLIFFFFFFFNATATTEIYTLSLHDALPIFPAFVVQCHYSNLRFRLETWRTPETRTMAYLEQLLTLDQTVKEIKLFSLGEPLLARYAKIFSSIFEEDAKVARESSIKAVLWGLLATI